VRTSARTVTRASSLGAHLMHTVRVSWLALYYALTHYALLALPSRFATMRRVSTLVPSSRQEGAPCIWPCALADGGRLSSTSTPSSTRTRDGNPLPPLVSLCLSLSLSFLFGSFLRRFSLPRTPDLSPSLEESFRRWCRWCTCARLCVRCGYAARFIS